MNNIFDENDLEELFSDKAPKEPQSRNVAVIFDKKNTPQRTLSTPQKPSAFKTFLKFIAVFAFCFGGIFFVFNYNAVMKEIRYFWDVKVRGGAYALEIPIPESGGSFNSISEATLIIPKIGVEAPIIWEVGDDQMDAKLLEGVVHYQNTALPDNEGNTFITGHSSYFPWSDSKYKDVFALLNKLEVGDQIYIQYHDKSFNYRVTDTKVVSPDEISVLDQTPGYNVTLMTCVPVGTSLNRLIISAEEV